MPATLERLTQDAMELPQSERARLAHAIIASMDDETDHDASEVWNAEIKNRVEEIRGGKVRGIPAAEVFARLKGKFH